MLADLPVAAVKTGMLATAEIVELVARRAAAGDLPHLVVDPVMVASSGDRLLDEDAESAYRELLFPHAEVITPNLLEAAVIVGRSLTTVDDAASAAQELAAEGTAWVVVKGGHLDGDATDLVVHRGELTRLTSPARRHRQRARDGLLVRVGRRRRAGPGSRAHRRAGAGQGLHRPGGARRGDVAARWWPRTDRPLRLGAVLVISTTAAIVALVGTLAALAYVAHGAGSGKSLDVYLTARDSQSTIRLSLAFLASGLGAWMLFAPPEVGQYIGVLGVIGYAVGGALPFVAYAWLGPKIRDAAPDGVTLTDWVRERFGRAGPDLGRRGLGLLHVHVHHRRAHRHRRRVRPPRRHRSVGADRPGCRGHRGLHGVGWPARLPAHGLRDQARWSSCSSA